MSAFSLLRSAICLACLLLAAPAHADHIKVFLLGGQSNMQGNNALASQLPPNLQGRQDDVLLYSGTNAAATFDSLQPGAGNNFGPEVSFGRAIADGRPHGRFCLIKFAQGSTNLYDNWDPATGSVYAEFRRTVTYGLEALTKAGHTYEIVGMCWTQGENDVQDFRTTAQYQADLNEFIADIRTRYGAGVKFFISRLSNNQTWRPASQVNEIRTAQDNVAAADPLSYVIDTDGFDMRTDNLHFEETGFVAIGVAFGQAYLNSLPVDSTAPAISTLSPAHTVSGVDPTANLTITFTEDITFDTGAIRLMQTGGTPVESFNVANPPANLTLSGATITINPTALLSPTTGYYLEIDATAIDDLAGNSFIGISGDGTWSFTTSAADTTAPGIASLSPAHSATGILFNTNLRITFSENIAFGTGEIRLRQTGGTLVQSFDVANPPANLTLSGTTLAINPSADLSASTGYYVEIDATAIDDAVGNSFPGFIGNGTWSFTTTAALISGSKITATASIHSGSTAMPFMTIDGSGLSGGVHGTAASTKWNTPTVDITNQWIQWDLGASYTLDSIHVWNYKDQFVSSIKSVDIYYSNAPIPGDPEGAGAANWTKLGGASVQLPEAPASSNIGFDLETAISTTLPGTEVRFIRFELNTNWQESTSYRTGLAEIQFTAKPGGPDLTAPSVGSLSPTHTATAVALASNLSVTFNENVAFGTGAIRLRRQSDNALIESFNVASPPVGLTLSGSTMTLNPTADLTSSTTYYVEIDATAIDDLSGNSFPGFSGDGTWRFTSLSADTTLPTINSLNPTHTATGISYSSNLVITFSENVAFGTGAIRLRRQSDNSVIESLNVASPPPNLTLSGSSVTLNPTSDLAPATTYYVEIDATAIDDLAGNSFAGVSGSATWSFTVASAPSSGGLITTGITASASSFINVNTAPSKTIDNSGMVGEVHGSSTQQSWMSTDTDDLANEWIQWDLGATHVLDRIQVWNYNDFTRFDSGIKQADIYVSALANPGDPEGAGSANWTQVGTDVIFSKGQGAATSTYTGFDLETVTGISLPGTAIRWIRFEVDSTYWDNSSPGNGLGPDQAALSEIRFYEAAETPSNTFADWIGGYTGLGGLTAFGDDADGDGIKNGIEAFFGTAPNAPNAGLSAVALSGNSLTFTHPKANPQLINVTGSYQWSLDLSAWNASGANVGGTIVTIGAVQDTPAPGTTTVTSTVTGTEPGQIFVRAVATQN